ncbi:MAG: histidine kinase [Gammaproteobacteria bacterium]|nr:MAG: histidine kinase [Gammaproteobacteria bacterium]
MDNELSDSIIIARQAIFDSELKVYAYELLFRGLNPTESGVDEFNGDFATTQVINNTFMGFGIEHVLGDKLGFINLTRSFLTGKIPLPFESGQLVLEILEDIEVDEEVVEGAQRLVEQGFTIALDDFIYSEEQKPLIKLASIIKIDILALTEEELVEHVRHLKKEKVLLLAEKVETEEQFRLCQRLGFHYYQGYFFCRPDLISGKALPENKLSALQILNSLQDPDITIADLELLVRQDVGLTFKLLRFLNSSAVGLPKKVESIHQGLVFLGLQTIKSWVTVLAFSDIKPKVSELSTAALLRAKMCTELAEYLDCDSEGAFILGLFSLLDAILEKPMAEIIDTLPIENEIKEALLLQGDGPHRELLNLVIAHEQGKLHSLPAKLELKTLNKAFLASTEWVNSIESML